MSRAPLWLKLAPPLAAVAAVSIAIFLSTRCSPEDEARHHPVSLHSQGEASETQPDPDKWAAVYRPQLPPPEELTEDASVTRGRLDNGFRYVVMERPDEGGRISLRLLVKAGSMHEEEPERGLAHFVEHMAFQGTVSLPGNSLQIFERLGLRSGADTNAWTSPDHTGYKLDLPVADLDTLETAFHFLRDVADGILFSPEEVESERQVVLREMEQREANRDGFYLHAAAILPQVPAAQRAPIGLRSVVESATPGQLRAFWRTHYVPSRMTLVATGDFKEKELIARITAHFSSLEARKPPLEPEDGNPLPGEGVMIDLLPIPSKGGKVRIAIAAPQPAENRGDSPAERRRGQAMRLHQRMMFYRLGRAAAGAGTGCAIFPGYNGGPSPRYGWLELSAETKRQSLLSDIEFLAREWHRACDHGFNNAEFAEAKGDLRMFSRRSFATRLSSPTASAANDLTKSILNGIIYESPENELNRYRQSLSSLTKEECEQSCREWWGHGLLHVVISGNVPPDLTEDQVSAALAKAWGRPAADAPAEETIPPLNIAPFGPPGRISRKQLDKDRGVLEVEFSNHVVARLKPLFGLGGCTSITVHAGFGPLAVPQDNPGLGRAAEMLAAGYPLSGWTQKQFDATLADTEVSSRFDLVASPVCSFRWSGETDRSSLQTQLELLCAQVIRPGFASFKKPLHPSRADLSRMDRLRTEWMGDRRLEETVAAGDNRFSIPEEALLRTDSTQVKEWLMPQLRNARLCVIIAGDFAPLDALPILACTFGALSDREPWDIPCPYPPVPIPDPGSIPVQSGTPQAFADVLFPRPPARTADESWHQALSAELLKLRLTSIIREALGESYSPSVSLERAPGSEWLLCRVPCSPGKSENTGASLRNVIEEFRTKGWTDDEYTRAARPLAFSLRSAARTPSWWLRTLSNPEPSPLPEKENADTLRAMQPAVARFTEALLDPANRREILMEPVKAAETEGERR